MPRSQPSEVQVHSKVIPVESRSVVRLPAFTSAHHVHSARLRGRTRMKRSRLRAFMATAQDSKPRPDVVGAITTVLFTSMRSGDACSWRWTDVHLNRCASEIERNAERRHGTILPFAH